jgi:hypothetical protein
MAIIYGMADSEKNLLNKLPNEVENVDDIDRVRKEFYKKMKKQRNGYGRKSIGGIIFSEIKRWHYKRQVDKFQYKKIGKLVTGTKGENKVIDELLKLDDSYHVLCGVKIELPYFVTYRGEKNLRSAQMDLVVVCPKGIFMIEVKNWTDEYAQRSNQGFSPYEQTERAGRVLWIAVQNIIKDCRINNVLLSITGNLPYNAHYPSVFVSSLNDINSFLEKRTVYLNEDEVHMLVDNLQDFARM